MSESRAGEGEMRYRSVGTVVSEESNEEETYRFTTELFEGLVCGCLVHNFARHQERCS